MPQIAQFFQKSNNIYFYFLGDFFLPFRAKRDFPRHTLDANMKRLQGFPKKV
jgi:hypothetical protein